MGSQMKLETLQTQGHQKGAFYTQVRSRRGGWSTTRSYRTAVWDIEPRNKHTCRTERGTTTKVVAELAETNGPKEKNSVVSH